MQAASRKVIGSLSLLAGVTFVLFLFSYFDSGVVHIRQKVKILICQYAPFFDPPFFKGLCGVLK